MIKQHSSIKMFEYNNSIDKSFSEQYLDNLLATAYNPNAGLSADCGIGSEQLHRDIRESKPETHILEIIERYPTAVQEKNTSGDYPLHLACKFCFFENVTIKLIELFPMAAQQKNGNGDYPLHIACRNPQLEYNPKYIFSVRRI